MLTNFALLLNTILLALAIANFFTIRRPQIPIQEEISISLLIPVRDEAENIVELVNTLDAQEYVSSLEIIFINDSSTDDTYTLLKSAQDRGSKISILNAPEPPADWLGKPWALQQGFDNSKGEIIITLDADVRLGATAISQAVQMLGMRDFISPYPRQLTKSMAERFIQPLLQWSWMTTVPIRLAEKSGRSSLAVANGQFFLVRRTALEKIGGFKLIKRKVLDDIELARSLISSGARGGVADGSSIAETRMYKNFSELKAGYGKSLWQAFGSKQGATIALTFIFITGILPVLSWFSGNPLGFLAYEFIVITRMLSAARSKSRKMDAFLHPISSLILIYLILYSWRVRKTVQWKGRTL